MNCTMTDSRQIRVKVICVIYRGEEILVFEARDQHKAETYYRPLGGVMEFGEYSMPAVRREFREEINSELENLRYRHVFENIFMIEGRPYHEIVFVFQGDLVNKSIYDKPFIYGQEDNGQPFKALWKALSDFNDGPPLYPDGLLEFLMDNDANLQAENI